MHNDFNPDESSQDSINQLKAQRNISISNNGKRLALKGSYKILQLLKGSIKTALTTLLGILGPLGLLAGFIGLLFFLVVMGIYGGMSKDTLLTSITAQACDVDVQQYATNRANKANIFNTWVVPGEGSWHEKNKEDQFKSYSEDYSVNYSYDTDGEITFNTIQRNNSQGWQFLGRLADNDGKDLQLMNYWGDVYAPMLFDSLRYNDRNLLEDEKYRSHSMQEAGYFLKPYFYYKESTITIETTDSEGETNTIVNDIYLLVEAYSIRGHKQYQYKWETQKDGDTEITKEVLKDTIIIDDGKKYLASYLDEKFEIDSSAENYLTALAVFEAMQGFTAGQEWAGWLQGNGLSNIAMISSASIPLEYRTYLKEAQEITGIPEHILAAVIMQESTWNPNAVNERTGCFGLTQLNPLYWDAWAGRYGFDPNIDKWNPRVQILVGAQVLKGFMQDQPDWESEYWENDKNFRGALAMYGGYKNDIAAAKGYIDGIVAKAKAYLKPSVFPVIGYGWGDITSPYAFRTFRGEYKFHGGIDIGCVENSDVVSVSSGVVTEIGVNGHGQDGETYGNYIIISDMNYKYLYGHLAQVLVSVNQTVTPGQKIALSGNTGRSSGAHLHFGISVINGDPKNYINTVNPASILQVP